MPHVTQFSVGVVRQIALWPNFGLSTTASCPGTGSPPHLPNTVSTNNAALLLALSASDGLPFDVHQVTVHAGPARKRRHDAVRVAVFALLVPEGLPVEKVAVLQRDLAVPIGAHLVRQLGHGEQSLEHLVHVGVPLSRDLEVGAVLVAAAAADQLLDLVLLHLAVKVPVALVAADDERHVRVLLGLVAETRFGLVDLALETLHLLEGLPAVQAEHQDENVACGQGGEEESVRNRYTGSAQQDRCRWCVWRNLAHR